MAPGIVTVFARYPAAATATFTATASGSSRSALDMAADTRSSPTSDVHHKTAAAAAVTERLSSSLIGIDSTAAAVSAASQGIQMENHGYAGGITVVRHHQQSNEPPAPPRRMKAQLPATDFSGFHGSRGLGMCRPASVAMPSPKARTPHADAAMSRRSGKTTRSSRTAIGYKTMPERARRRTSPGRYSLPARRGSAYRLNATAPPAMTIDCHGVRYRSRNASPPIVT
jgi:hypothetical protein